VGDRPAARKAWAMQRRKISSVLSSVGNERSREESAAGLEGNGAARARRGSDGSCGRSNSDLTGQREREARVLTSGSHT
jgi:hypothetical protein